VLSLLSGVWLLACGEDDSGSSSTGGAAGTSGGTAGSGGGGGTTTSGGSGGSGGGVAGSGAQGGSAGAATGGSAGAASGGSAGAATGGSAGAASGGAAGAGGSGGGQSGPSVACGSAACPVSTSYCCNHPNQPDECKTNGTSCTFGVEMACDGPEDCGAAQVCCATLFIQGKNVSYTSTACATTCSAKTERVVCGQSGTCPSGQTCGTSDLLPPYKDCK